jgi:predicted anti-sigma-YlaC factor YlaD
MAALELAHPGFRKSLEQTRPDDWPHLQDKDIGLAYWAAASWGGFISLSKDSPDTVADLPLAVRLAQLAYTKDPHYGNGSLASLLGSFETARAGGSLAQALVYFDRAIALGANTNASALVAKAEGLSLPHGNRLEFETLLRQAVAVSIAHPNMQNVMMRERAQWLLRNIDDLFNESTPPS